jgi:hypothetical protein
MILCLVAALPRKSDPAPQVRDPPIWSALQSSCRQVAAAMPCADASPLFDAIEKSEKRTARPAQRAVGALAGPATPT